MDKIVCHMCNIYKSSHNFSKLEDKMICHLCHKLTLKYFNEYGKTHLTCVMCQEKKIIGAFYRPINVLNLKNRHICKMCHSEKIQSEHSSLQSYIRKIYGNLSKSVKYHNHRYQHLKLPFEITIDGIENLYTCQAGKCSLTGRDLTYQYYAEKDTKIKYPDNLTIQMIDISLGYIPSNITLTCLNVSRNQIKMIKKFISLDKSKVTTYESLIVSSPVHKTDTIEENMDEIPLEHIFDDVFLRGAELLLSEPLYQ